MFGVSVASAIWVCHPQFFHCNKLNKELHSFSMLEIINYHALAPSSGFAFGVSFQLYKSIRSGYILLLNRDAVDTEADNNSGWGERCSSDSNVESLGEEIARAILIPSTFGKHFTIKFCFQNFMSFLSKNMDIHSMPFLGHGNYY